MRQSAGSIAEKWLWYIVQTAIIVGLTTLLAYVLDSFGIQSSSIKFIYLLGIIVVVLQSGNFIMTTIASLAFVLIDMMLFTDPSEFHQTSFIISTVIFIFIALVINILYSYLQRRIDEAKRNEQVHKRLYEASEGLLSVHGEENIIKYADEKLTELAGTDVNVFIGISSDDQDEAKEWCFKNSAACGYGEVDFPDRECKYIPIRSNKKTIGVVTIDCFGKKISKVTIDCVMALISQIATAIERDILEQNNKKEAAVFAREKIKSSVMKDLSHKMYPHISGIKNVALKLSEDDSVTAKYAEDINALKKDADYVIDAMDNILDITRN